MIKIEIPKSAVEKHWDYFKQVRIPTLNRIIADSTGKELEFLQFLLDSENDNQKLKDIITGTPDTLLAIINEVRIEFGVLFEPLIPKNFKEKLEKIFNYKSFTLESEHNEDSWWAYKFTKSLSINTCPYCNRQYTHTFYSRDGKTRPELDHFYPQYKFPYLALSIYNMVPACHICNSNLKGAEDFFENPHINPYVEGFQNDAIFKTNIIPDVNGNYSITHLQGIGTTNDFELKLKINPDSSLKQKIENSNKTFKIEELYQFHKDYVLEVMKRTVFYNETRIVELANKEPYKGLFLDREEITQILIGNYVDEMKLPKRVLSKLTKDIWEEFRLDEVWGIKDK